MTEVQEQRMIAAGVTADEIAKFKTSGDNADFTNLVDGGIELFTLVRENTNVEGYDPISEVKQATKESLIGNEYFIKWEESCKKTLVDFLVDKENTSGTTLAQRIYLASDSSKSAAEFSDQIMVKLVEDAYGSKAEALKALEKEVDELEAQTATNA